jgi:integrase
MKHGAIRWRADSDKQGIERITPISLTVRTELDAYLAANPRLGEVPLLPMTDEVDHGTPEKTLTRNVASNWLAKAERLAGLPKLRGGLWHAYRRLWATERKNLPDVDVAEAGGWTGTKAMKLAYQHATASGVLAAVNQ